MKSVDKIRICKYSFCSPSVPKEFDGTKILFLTDIHHSKRFQVNLLKDLIKKANEMKPDIILLGGDYIGNQREFIISFFKEASKLTAPLGVYGVLGNHDRKTDGPLSLRCMRRACITSLENHAVWVCRNGAKIRLGGVGDMITHTQNIKPMVSGINKNELKILVTHNPDYALKMPADIIDLMFCGHTHGGQISLFGRWAPPHPGGSNKKYLTGIVKEGSTTMIISNGIGTSRPHIRIFTPPQIWEVTLISEK